MARARFVDRIAGLGRDRPKALGAVVVDTRNLLGADAIHDCDLNYVGNGIASG